MRNRQTYQNDGTNIDFSDDLHNARLSSAVDTANLISILDPASIANDEVETIANATDSSKEFVDGMADIVDGHSKELVKAASTSEDPNKAMEETNQKFSNITRDFIFSAVANNNIGGLPFYFSEDQAEQKVLDVAKIATLVDPDVMEQDPTAEIAKTIADATGTPQDVCEELVDNAKEQFSNGGTTLYLSREDIRNFANAINTYFADADVKITPGIIEAVAELNGQDNANSVEYGVKLQSLKNRFLAENPNVPKEKLDGTWKDIMNNGRHATETDEEKKDFIADNKAKADELKKRAENAEALRRINEGRGLGTRLKYKWRGASGLQKAGVIGAGAALAAGAGYGGYKLYKHFKDKKAAAEAANQIAMNNGAQYPYQPMNMSRPMNYSDIPQLPNLNEVQDVPLEVSEPQDNQLLGEGAEQLQPVSNLTPVQGVVQPASAANDAQVGQAPSDPMPVANTFKIQNELATTAAVANSPVPVTSQFSRGKNNFSRSNDGIDEKKKQDLISLLGDNYIPNK